MTNLKTLLKWLQAKQDLRRAIGAEKEARYELCSALLLIDDHPVAVSDGDGGFWIVSRTGKGEISVTHTSEMQP